MRRFLLPVIFAFLGFMFSTKLWIKTNDKIPPEGGLLIYYTIITITLLILQYFGLIIGGTTYNSWQHTVGSILIIFSFFIIFDWESCYINYVAKGKCEEKDISNVYLGSEDGAVYNLWRRTGCSPEKARLLTYVLTPFVLTLIGVSFLSSGESVKLGHPLG